MLEIKMHVWLLIDCTSNKESKRFGGNLCWRSEEAGFYWKHQLTCNNSQVFCLVICSIFAWRQCEVNTRLWHRCSTQLLICCPLAVQEHSMFWRSTRRRSPVKAQGKSGPEKLRSATDGKACKGQAEQISNSQSRYTLCPLSTHLEKAVSGK